MNNFKTSNSLDGSDPVFTLSVISKLSGVPISSIRQYIDRGLIVPYKKDSSRHLFSKVDILRLRYINKLLTEEGLNIAGIRASMALIPCWAIRLCSTKDRHQCEAYHSSSGPCWEASEKGRKCKNKDCRECGVYRFLETDKDIKSLIKTLI